MLDGNRGFIVALAGLAALICAAGFGAYFGSLHAPDRKDYQAVAGDQRGPQEYSGPSESLRDIAGIPGPIERAIVNPRPATGQDHEQRDLAAQEAAALWGFWMVLAAFATFGVTSLGTILIWRQVSLTREAVEDTGRATMAMERQNELTAKAQRAWVVFDATITNAAVDGNRLTFTVEVSARNIGHSVADETTMFACIVMKEAKMDEAIKSVRNAVERDDAFKTPLVPGDARQHWCQGNYSINHMEPNEKTGKVEILIFVGARYSVIGEADRKIAERAFSICEVDVVDPFGTHGITHPAHPLLDAEQLKMFPAGRVRAT